jgi:sugar phosphate isomerase/epimerase
MNLLGIKTWNLQKFTLLDEFEIIEIYGGDPLFTNDCFAINRIKKLLNGKKILFHSKELLFSKKGSYEKKKSLDTLKKEILICSKIGARYLVIHLKSNELTKEEINMFRKIIKFAWKRDILLVYELNNHAPNLENIEKNMCLFPEIGFNLDIGHLNLYRKKYSAKQISSFIKNVEKKIKILHIHNNFGKKDEHNSIEDGNLNWKDILRKISLKNKILIIESKGRKEIFQTKSQLVKFAKLKT